MSTRKFTPLFVLALGVVAAGTFFLFTSYARGGIKERRDASRENLKTLAAALSAYATLNGAFPDDPVPLLEKSVPPQRRVNPSWPESPGYVCIGGARPGDGPLTLLLYENVPPQKQRVGRLAALLNGEVVLLEERDFRVRVQAQESQWRSEGRRWNAIALPLPRE